MSDITILPGGDPERRGAHFDGKGTAFSLFSAHATKVELCLFDETGKTEIARLPLPQKTGDVWHGYVPEVKPGQVYGYRVHGPYDPSQGHFFNPNRLMLDPYAREIAGKVEWNDDQDDPRRDNAGIALKGRVTAPLPKPAAGPGTPWKDTTVYELHPKGFTVANPDLPEEKRGRLTGLADDRTIAYIKELGITTVELMPVHAKLDDARLCRIGLSNYWGYNTVSYFAPEPSYGTREEFRDMVDKFHKAGIEVVLDVVYNHTAEAGPDQPSFSFRGIDNASYYKLDPGNKSRYIDDTGTGNTLNFASPEVRRMTIDSLRYWAEEMGVDGFRFDLAPVLGRAPWHFDAHAPLFKEIEKDPVLSRVKLIAEPWDVGPGGYQVGHFPSGWHEWNDRFRDGIRHFWRGDDGQSPEKATRLSGSHPEFGWRGRPPQASINFVAIHDGMTLEDIVSHSHKKNEANGEGNRDGHNDNITYNYGAEGPTDDPAVTALRERQKRNMLASVFLAQGVPMMQAGDEHGHTQGGNNNAYCQDNKTSWLDWAGVTEAGKKLTSFVKKLVAFRKAHPVLTHDQYLHSMNADRHGGRDLVWCADLGREKTDWSNPHSHAIAMLLNEDAMKKPGEEQGGERLFMVFNANAGPAEFRLPANAHAGGWRRVLDTSAPEMDEDKTVYPQGGTYAVPERSVVVFSQKSPRIG